jgi:hypothetical protein
MYSDESVVQPGILTIRTRFDEYTGLYVTHCHRLNHEDNGLMALINRGRYNADRGIQNTPGERASQTSVIRVNAVGLSRFGRAAASPAMFAGHWSGSKFRAFVTGRPAIVG